MYVCVYVFGVNPLCFPLLIVIVVIVRYGLRCLKTVDFIVHSFNLLYVNWGTVKHSLFEKIQSEIGVARMEYDNKKKNMNKILINRICLRDIKLFSKSNNPNNNIGY